MSIGHLDTLKQELPELLQTRDRMEAGGEFAGGACKDVLKEAGVKIGNNLARVAIEKIPGKVLIELNKKVGFRLITKAGEKGAVNLMKMVPLAGGIVGAAFDASACRIVGKQAKRTFYAGEAKEEQSPAAPDT